MKGILGKKLGMTQVFTKDGIQIPVTVIEVVPNTVLQVKTLETDGYNAIQLGAFDKKDKQTTKPLAGHFAKAETAPKRFVREFTNFEGAEELTVGDELDATIFELGQWIDIQGTSKGKGYTGAIVRNNQSKGPSTHGSRFHRRPGSMGSMQEMRVRKGKILAGQHGNKTRTVQNSSIIAIKDNLLLVKGNVPGANKNFVKITTAVKCPNKKSEVALLNYNNENAGQD